MAGDLKRMRQRGADIRALSEALEVLASGRSLPASYQDHDLEGKWSGCRECHIESDWLLIYRHQPQMITAVRTGTHQDLF
jgi:mRNA interferase YafQ